MQEAASYMIDVTYGATGFQHRSGQKKQVNLIEEEWRVPRTVEPSCYDLRRMYTLKSLENRSESLVVT